MRQPQEFFAIVRREYGGLDQDQVDGFNTIIAEAERRNLKLDFLAYMLATAYWETGRTMQPIKEYGGRAYFMRMYDKTGSRPHVARALGNTVTGDGATYCGRGYVQLTGRSNYARASAKLGEDFVNKPNLVMQPEHAARIMFEGMTEGWFTGKDLDDYIDGVDESDAEDLREFIAARRIINGTDKARTIGGFALTFKKALEEGGYGEASPVNTAPVQPPLPDDPGPAAEQPETSEERFNDGDIAKVPSPPSKRGGAGFAVVIAAIVVIAGIIVFNILKG